MGLTALAGALRFLGLGCLPPGLYHDEAINGLDALRVLRGSFPTYFPANHGREPLFIYLAAAVIHVLGRTPGAIRLAAAICGTLTVPATYWMTRSWFKRSTALLSTAIVTIVLWHVHLSRIGFRAVTLPLVTACFLASAGRALQTQRRTNWVLTGVLYGLMFYTYVAARFTPVALLLFAGYFVLLNDGRRIWPGAAYLGLGATVSLVPLGIYAVNHWDVFMGRPAQVSILNPIVHRGSLWGALGRNLIATLRMFFVSGDTIARHNLPGRPVFTLPLGAAMVLGTFRAFVQARKGHSGSALVLIWVAAMSIPTLAAADAPHFLRAVGVLPALAVLPALGLDVLRDELRRRAPYAWGSLLICLVLAFGLGSTARDYFVRYGQSADVHYAFESAATDLAAEINRFTGVGWNGEGLAATAPSVGDHRRAYVDRRLWQAWESLAFLVPEETVARVLPRTTENLALPDRSLIVLWPHGDLQATLEPLPHPATVEVRVGPLTRGDLEERPYPAYASYYVTPIAEQGSGSVARFGDAIELVDYRITPDEMGWRARLLWRAASKPTEDYTAFVYLCNEICDAERILAQDDAQPGTLFYPTRAWYPGDVIVDDRSLELRADRPAAPSATLAVGLYSWPAMERLPVTEPAGTWSDGMLLLPLEE